MNNQSVEVVTLGLRGGGDSIFNHVISIENILEAWREFKKGKTKKVDVQEFHFNLENNIFELHDRLEDKVWRPDKYTSFFIRDPKLRHIHKATVRDRVFNQALFRILYPIFDKNFIFDSYSCRDDKGVHKGVLRLESFLRQSTSNNRSYCFALKCDIKKFFDSISHQILFGLIKNKIKDEDVLEIIKLTLSTFETQPGKGLPLGNVTSQLFANVYLNRLDQFIKHNLKVESYLRYCDDFIILNKNKELLVKFVPKIKMFLRDALDLELHPRKVEIRRNTWGVDFLGYVVLPHHRVIRNKTKFRVIRKMTEAKKHLDKKLINEEYFRRLVSSYKGLLSHCKGYKIEKTIDLMVGGSKPPLNCKRG